MKREKNVIRILEKSSMLNIEKQAVSLRREYKKVFDKLAKL